MKKLILYTLASFLVGCSAPAPIPSATTSPTPIPATSGSPATQTQESKILAEASSWKTVDDVWARVHPQCKAQFETEPQALESQKKALAGVLVLSSGGPAGVEPHSATPNPAYMFPVPPTHVIRAEDGKIMFFVAAPAEGEWHVVLTARTEAGKKADGEYKLEDDQAKELAAKVLSELTEEQRAFLRKTFKEKGKIAAIKELRKMSVHSLKIAKMVVESL